MENWIGHVLRSQRYFRDSEDKLSVVGERRSSSFLFVARRDSPRIPRKRSNSKDTHVLSPSCGFITVSEVLIPLSFARTKITVAWLVLSEKRGRVSIYDETRSEPRERYSKSYGSIISPMDLLDRIALFEGSFESFPTVFQYFRRTWISLGDAVRFEAHVAARFTNYEHPVQSIPRRKIRPTYALTRALASGRPSFAESVASTTRSSFPHGWYTGASPARAPFDQGRIHLVKGVRTGEGRRNGGKLGLGKGKTNDSDD